LALEEGCIGTRAGARHRGLGTTGLIDYSIIGPADSSVESVEQYLRRTKGWFDGDFGWNAGVSPMAACDVVRRHPSLRRGGRATGGLSVELLLDPTDHGDQATERAMQ